jgi:hypothetical protein
MPATVNANMMSLVHASSTGISSMFPDLCKTPTPAGPIPIPYPNIAQSSDTADGSSTVKVDGNPIMLKGSNFKMSAGDEAGAAQGVVSNKIKGKAEPLLYSFDVKVDGANVMRLTDMMLQNVGNPPNTPPGTEVQGPVLGTPAVTKECEKTQEKAEEQSKSSTSWGASGIVAEHKGPIQSAATAEKVVIYFRATKGVCGPWISLKHRPKPHSCMSGTTIKGEDVPKVQRWLDDYFDRMDPTQADLYQAMPPIAGSKTYCRYGAEYVGIIGISVGGGKIKPVKGSGTQTISYEGKWMTGDYDLFEIVSASDKCEKVTGDAFAKVRNAINKGCAWDAVQHPAQAQWVPDEHEQEQGVAKFDMNARVKAVLKGDAPLTDAVKWRTDRKGMDVLDAPLTVVSGNGVVTLKDKQDVKDALICQGCAK